MAEIKYLSYEGLKQYDGLIKQHIADLLTAANGDITAVDTLLKKVIGDDLASSVDAQKSIRTIANEELAAQLIPENAKEALDTLQEIAAWIQNHPDDAAAMNAAIQANAEAIGAEVSHVATEEDVTAGKAEQVGDKVVDSAASGLTAKVAALEGLMGEDSVEDQIDAAIDALAGSATGSDAVENTAEEGEPSNAVPAKVTVTVESENGEVSRVAVVTNDIASASDLGDLRGDFEDLKEYVGHDGEAAQGEVGQEGYVAAKPATGLTKRVADMEALFTGGEGSVAEQIETAVSELADTVVDSSDDYEGGAYNEAADAVKPTVTVTLGGTVEAPTVEVEHNIDTITEADIDKLFEEEEAPAEPQA